MNLDKPLADLEPEECLEEIKKRVDLNSEVGKEIDMLAFQMMTYWLRSARTVRESVESASRNAKINEEAFYRLRELLDANQGRKTVAFDDVHSIYRSLW